MPLDRCDAVRGLVLLEELALAGQLGVADLDGRAVCVEPPEDLGGGEGARLVESLLEDLLGVEHRGPVGDLDLDGEGGLGASDDGGGHSDLLGFRRLILRRETTKRYIDLRSTPPLPTSVRVVLPAEGDPAVGEADQAAVADS